MFKNNIDVEGNFTSNKYIVDEETEKQAFKLACLDFIDKREDEENSIVFVPNYSCNFACSLLLSRRI